MDSALINYTHSTELTRILLAAGAEFNASNNNEVETISGTVAEHNDIDIVNAFLNSNIDIAGRYIALRSAVYHGFIDIVELLLEHGTNVNGHNEEDYSAVLHIAAGKGFTDIVELLLERGADIDIRDYTDSTALHLAAKSGHTDTVKLLIEKGADVIPKDRDGVSLLCGAILNNRIEVVKYLLSIDARIDREFALHTAALNGFDEMVNLLIDYGFDVNALERNKSVLECATAKCNVNTVERLLKKGAIQYINRVGQKGMTPLLNAAKHRNAGVVRLLIDNGANIEMPDDEGRTPLNYAMRWEIGDRDVTESKIEIIKLLLDSGARGKDLLLFEVLPYHGIEIIKTVLSYGIDPRIRNEGGYNLIEWTVYIGYRNKDVAIELLELFIAAGVMITNGSRLLRHSVSSGNYKIAQFLLDRVTGHSDSDTE